MRVRKAFVATGLAAGLAAGFAGAAASNPELASDVTYNFSGGRTPLEDKLTKAANETFDIDTSVRCASPEGLEGKTNPLTGNTVGATHRVPVRPTDQSYIRLAPEVCRGIAEIGHLTGAGEYSDLSGVARLHVAASVSVLAVQAADARYSGSRKELECYGTQKAAALAQRVGLPRADAVQLGLDLSRAELILTEADQRPGKECVNDGIYDLDPESPFGFFPYGENPTFPVE